MHLKFFSDTASHVQMACFSEEHSAKPVSIECHVPADYERNLGSEEGS